MRMAAVLVGAVAFASCGGGPSKQDVTGTWELTIDYTTCTSENLDSRGFRLKLSLGGGAILHLMQSGSEVTGTEEFAPRVARAA